jgi:TonB family protein
MVLFGPCGIAQSRPTHITVLDLGTTPTGSRAASEIRKIFQAREPRESRQEFELIDRDQSRAAALGTGFNGLLNMSVPEARDLGSAMACDFYFVGEAQTVKRSPSTGPDYYESYAAVFLVSARTGRLVLWERPAIQGDFPGAAEKALLANLGSDESRQRYVVAIRRAQEEERVERVTAIGSAAPIIEVMSDDDNGANQELRAPRPYRRLKPPYPEAAARAEVEATVDVLVDIDARGEVGRVEIARWAGYGLDQSVMDTVKQMHFFPAQRDGVAIPMRVLLRYNFRKPPLPNHSP